MSRAVPAHDEDPAVTARFDRLEQKVDAGFTEMRGKFDQAAAGQQQIVELLTGLIGQQGSEGDQ